MSFLSYEQRNQCDDHPSRPYDISMYEPGCGLRKAKFRPDSASTAYPHSFSHSWKPNTCSMGCQPCYQQPSCSCQAKPTCCHDYSLFHKLLTAPYTKYKPKKIATKSVQTEKENIIMPSPLKILQRPMTQFRPIVPPIRQYLPLHPSAPAGQVIYSRQPTISIQQIPPQQKSRQVIFMTPPVESRRELRTSIVQDRYQPQVARPIIQTYSHPQGAQSMVRIIPPSPINPSSSQNLQNSRSNITTFPNSFQAQKMATFEQPSSQISIGNTPIKTVTHNLKDSRIQQERSPTQLTFNDQQWTKKDESQKQNHIAIGPQSVPLNQSNFLNANSTNMSINKKFNQFSEFSSSTSQQKSLRMQSGENKQQIRMSEQKSFYQNSQCKQVINNGQQLQLEPSIAKETEILGIAEQAHESHEI